MSGETLQIPLNRTRLKEFFGFQIDMAIIGLVETSVMFILGIHCFILGRDEPFYIPFAFAWMLIGLLIGSAMLSALQVTCALMRTLKKNLPALVLSQEGVQDNASSYVIGNIPWVEVEGFVITSHYSRSLGKAFPGMAIIVRDKTVILQKKPKFMALWMNLEPRITSYCEIFIPQARLSMPIEDAVLFSNQYRLQHMPTVVR